MPEPLLQLILGALGTTILSLAGYIVKQWANERAALIADRNFWRERSLSKDERVDKLADTLAEAITLIRQSGSGARGANR